MKCEQYPSEVNVLRKRVNLIQEKTDGELVVNAVHVGQHFFASRKEANAKTNRSNFLKYMHKISLAQVDKRQLLAQAEAERAASEEAERLNYFAPAKNLKVLLREEWFGVLATDDKKYDGRWTDAFVDALMVSAWRDHIAREWQSAERRLMLKCMVIGLLKDAGVLKGSYHFAARQLELGAENPATLAKYMGMGKKQPFADWVEAYVKGA